jgi:ligand-binding sensor domain-containing protein
LDEVQKEFQKFELKDPRPLIDTENLEAFGDDLWFFGVRETLWKYNVTTGEAIDYSEILRSVTDKNFYLLGITKDASQQFWVTTSRGLIKLAPKTKEKFSFNIQSKDGFCEDNCYVQSIVASDTAIYFAYLYHVIAMSKKTKQFYRLNYDLENVNKGSEQESIWDEGAGKLEILDDQLIWLDQIINVPSLNGKDILSEQTDYRVVNSLIGNQTIWLAPYYPNDKSQQLFEYNLQTQQLKNISPDVDLVPEDYPLQILESKHHDKVWVVFEERGILEFSKSGAFLEKYDDPSINDNNCLYEDSKGNLWIGTKVGLTKIQIPSGKMKHFVNKTFNFKDVKRV